MTRWTTTSCDVGAWDHPEVSSFVQSPMVCVCFGAFFAFQEGAGFANFRRSPRKFHIPRLRISLYVLAKRLLGMGTQKFGCTGRVSDTSGGRPRPYHGPERAHQQRVRWPTFHLHQPSLRGPQPVRPGRRVVAYWPFLKQRRNERQSWNTTATGSRCLPRPCSVANRGQEPTMGGRRHKRASMLRLPKASSHSQRAEDQEARQVRFGPCRDWLETDRLASSGYTWSTSNAPHIHTRTDDTPELQAGGTTTPEPGGGAHRKRPPQLRGRDRRAL